MTINDFASNTGRYYKSLREKNSECSVQISVLNKGKKSILLPYCITETLAKDIKNIVRGEDYDKVQIEFDNKGNKTIKTFIPEVIEVKETAAVQNNFNSSMDIFGLGAFTGFGNPQNLGMAIKSEITRKVDEGRKEDKIKLLEEKNAELKKSLDKALQTIEDKEVEIECLEEENANIKKMKQSFSLQGVDLTELGGHLIGKFFKNNPAILTKGLGIPPEKLSEIFTDINSNTNTIQELASNNKNSQREENLKLIINHLRSLDEGEFNLTFAIIIETQADVQKKTQVYEYAKKLFSEENTNP